MKLQTACVLATLLLSAAASAQDSTEPSPAEEPAAENASNPLAAVNNTDIRWQHFDLGDGQSLDDISVDGAFMAMPTLKIRYELHYARASVGDMDSTYLDTLVLKGIWFPKQGVTDSGLKYRVALGLDWITDLGGEDALLLLRVGDGFDA